MLNSQITSTLSLQQSSTSRVCDGCCLFLYVWHASPSADAPKYAVKVAPHRDKSSFAVLPLVSLGSLKVRLLVMGLRLLVTNRTIGCSGFGTLNGQAHFNQDAW